MGADFYSNSYSKFFAFHDFMDILEDLYNLRHDNDLLNNFLKNVRNLNQNFFTILNLDWELFNSINNLQYFFDNIDLPDNFLHFFHNHNLFPFFLNFYNFLGVVLNCHNFLHDLLNFLQLLNDHGNLDNFVNDCLDEVVYSHKLRHNSLDLDEFRDFHHNLLDSFNFVDLGDCDGFFHHFFDDLLSCDDLLNSGFDCHNFLNDSWYLLNHLLNVRNDLLYLFDLLINHNFFNNFLDLVHNNFLLFGDNNFFDNLRNLNDPFSDFFLNHKLFHNPIDRHRNFDWSDDGSFHFYNLYLVDEKGDNFFNF